MVFDLYIYESAKHKFTYCDEIHVDEIFHLPYFDRFENVVIASARDKCPKSAKYIHFYADSVDIPKGITHLSFEHEFDKPLNDCIPPTVTHLVFGRCFNQSIYSCIPSSVTHLTFGNNFNKSIKGCIPSSVIYVTFGQFFNQSLRNLPPTVSKLSILAHNMNDIYIPPSIKKLILMSFGRNVRKCIPPTVTHLKLCHNYDELKLYYPLFSSTSGITHMTFAGSCKPIPNFIPSTVTHLKFSKNFTGSIDDYVPGTVIDMKKRGLTFRY